MLRNQQTTEVLCTGTFNLIHAGHVQMFEFASRFGLVTVGVNTDAYLQEKYGDATVPLLNRVYVLRSNKFVSNVVVFSESEPSALIRKLRPRYYIRGPDYKDVELPEQLACNEVNAQVIIQPVSKIHDSSKLISFLPVSAFTAIDPLDY